MNDATRKVIDTIQKLLAITVERGATPAEAATAAAKARYLLAEHELSIEQVDREGALGEIMDERLPLDKTSSARPHWQALATVIAEGFGCRMLVTYDWRIYRKRLQPRIEALNIVGREADARVAAMICDRVIIELRVQVDRMVKQFHRPRYAYEVAFIFGAAGTIGMRLKALVFDDAATNERYGALVIQKGADIERHLAGRGCKELAVKNPNAVDAEAFREGQRAGRQVNLQANGLGQNAGSCLALPAPTT